MTPQIYPVASLNPPGFQQSATMASRSPQSARPSVTPASPAARQPGLGVASLIPSGLAGKSMIKSTTPPTRSIIARGLPRLQHPVSHRRSHLTRPARDTPGHTRSEPPQCDVTPNDAGITPPLVPENLRHHDIPCATATPSANGRSSQTIPPHTLRPGRRSMQPPLQCSSLGTGTLRLCGRLRRPRTAGAGPRHPGQIVRAGLRLSRSCLRGPRAGRYHRPQPRRVPQDGHAAAGTGGRLLPNSPGQYPSCD